MTTHPYKKVSTRQNERYGNAPFWNNFSSRCKNCNKKSSAGTKLVWTNTSSQNQAKHIPGKSQKGWNSKLKMLYWEQTSHPFLKEVNPDTEYSCQTSLATRQQNRLHLKKCRHATRLERKQKALLMKDSAKMNNSEKHYMKQVSLRGITICSEITEYYRSII